MNQYIIQVKQGLSPRYLIDAPPTGFSSTKNYLKAMRFSSLDAVLAYRIERGVFNAAVLRLIKVGNKLIINAL